jgi:hypothetical protein
MIDHKAVRARFLARWVELRGPQQSAVDQAADRAVVTGAKRLIAELRFFGVEARLVDGALMLFGPTHKIDAARVLEVLADALTIDPALVALQKPQDGQETMPEGCGPKAWATAVLGQRRFVDEGWADKARACGWSDTELFAVPPQWSRLDLTGCALLLADKKVIEVSAGAITIETESGARQRLRRPPAVNGCNITVGGPTGGSIGVACIDKMPIVAIS